MDHAVRTRRIAVAAAFFAQGLLFITMTTHLPQVQQRFDLDALALSLLLLGMVLLAGVGSVVAEQVARRSDSARALRVGLGLIGVGVLGAGVAGTFGLFGGFLALYGVGLGMVDAAGNMQAVAIEHRSGRPLLPSFHAAWTLGGILATLVALALGESAMARSVSPLAILPLALLAAPLLTRDHGDAATDVQVSGVPWRRIVLVGLALVLFYMVDTAASTWGPVYLHTLFGTGLGNVAIATLPYLVATLAARLGGDWTVARFGVVGPLRVGAVLAFVALVAIVVAPSAPVAVAGFTLLGFGAGIVAPLSFSAAGSIAGADPALDEATRRARVDAVIARFNQFNYVGALLGAVMTGVVGAGDLRIGFALPMVLILGLWPLARSFAAGR